MARQRQMDRRLTLLLLGASLVSGCAGSRPAGTLPIRIGLLADSQITSPHGTPGCSYRSKSLDRQLEHAIRPPALEHLTVRMLEIALDKFPSDVDVILYLGDGANSGGEDEIEALFKVLGDYRRKSKVPIFVVIGNHDYLGAGNTPHSIERFLLLNHLRPLEERPLSDPYNRPLSKGEVLSRISAFNHDSNDLATNTMFRYTDNHDALDTDLDHNSGLYLAGRLVYPKQGEKTVEILLADTSDYADTPFRPELEIWDPFIPKWDVYGLQGAISSKDQENGSGERSVSQITYLKEESALSTPDFRFVASHFHADNLDRKRGDIPAGFLFELVNLGHGLWETVDGPLLGHRWTNFYVKYWLAEHKRNYWLSGHTHRRTMMHPSQGTVHAGGMWGFLTDASFRSVNVGSTTDYRAHIAVVERASRQEADNDRHVKKVDDYVQFREIPLFDIKERDEKQRLQQVLSYVEVYGRENRNVPHAIEYRDDAQFGLSLLGLNKDYQDGKWTVADTEKSRKRLDAFIDTFVSEYPENERADAIRCLAFIASACEVGRCNCRKGFDPDKCRLK